MLSNRSLLEHRARQLGRDDVPLTAVKPDFNIARRGGLTGRGRMLIGASAKGAAKIVPFVTMAATVILGAGIAVIAASLLQSLGKSLVEKVKDLLGTNPTEPKNPEPEPPVRTPLPQPKMETASVEPGAVTTAAKATILAEDPNQQQAKPAQQAAGAAQPESEGTVGPTRATSVAPQTPLPYERKEVTKAAERTAAPLGLRSSTGTIGAIIKKASETVGVDAGTMLAIAKIESGLDPNARASRGSATGLFQLVADTWAELVKKYGAQYGISVGDIADPWANAIIAAIWLKQNIQLLVQRAGISNPTATDLYVVHFFGRAGALDFFANLGKIGAQVFPKAARANRNIFYDKSGKARTLAQIYQLFADKIGQARAVVGQAAAAIEQEYQRLSATSWMAGPMAEAGGGGGGGALLAQQGGRQERRPVGFENGMITADQSAYFG
jgi:hypothetical protein